MKTKIKHLSRTEQQVNLTFELDSQIIKNIEKTFQKLNPNFKLLNYKKKYGDKIFGNFWELNKKDEIFNFMLVVRKEVVKFKLKSKLDFIDKFLKILYRSTEFLKLSPRIREKLKRRGFGDWLEVMHKE